MASHRDTSWSRYYTSTFPQQQPTLDTVVKNSHVTYTVEQNVHLPHVLYAMSSTSISLIPRAERILTKHVAYHRSLELPTITAYTASQLSSWREWVPANGCSGVKTYCGWYKEGATTCARSKSATVRRHTATCYQPTSTFSLYLQDDSTISNPCFMFPHSEGTD